GRPVGVGVEAAATRLVAAQLHREGLLHLRRGAAEQEVLAGGTGEDLLQAVAPGPGQRLVEGRLGQAELVAELLLAEEAVILRASRRVDGAVGRVLRSGVRVAEGDADLDAHRRVDGRAVQRVDAREHVAAEDGRRRRGGGDGQAPGGGQRGRGDGEGGADRAARGHDRTSHYGTIGCPRSKRTPSTRGPLQ